MQDANASDRANQTQNTPTIAPIGDEELNFRLREYIKTYNETLKRHSVKLNKESETKIYCNQPLTTNQKKAQATSLRISMDLLSSMIIFFLDQSDVQYKFFEIALDAAQRTPQKAPPSLYSDFVLKVILSPAV